MTYELSPLFEKILKQWSVPGAAIGIIKDNKITFAQGYGVEDLETEKAITPDTAFPIASISKAFTGTCISILCDRGYLKWQDRVMDHLDHFQLYDPWVTQNFKILDLLCHRSGLPAQSLNCMAPWGYTRNRIRDSLKYVKPASSFRSEYAYHNALYLYVEDLIKKYTNLSYPDFLKHYIFTPLGMKNVVVGRGAAKQLDHFITGHVLDEETKTIVKPIDFSHFSDVFYEAGGIVASLNDVMKWMQCQINRGDGLISPQMWDFMQTPQVSIEPQLSYGMGWRLLDDRPHRVISHGGLIQGIKNLLAYVPELKSGIVVLSSLTDSDAPFSIVHSFLDDLMELPIKNYSTDLWKKRDFKPRPAPASINQDFDVFEGRFINPILGSIILKNNQLMLEETGKKADLTAIDDKTFSVFFKGCAGEYLQDGRWGHLVFNSTYDSASLIGGPSSEDSTFTLHRCD